jgi:hypothetical protein
MLNHVTIQERVDWHIALKETRWLAFRTFVPAQQCLAIVSKYCFPQNSKRWSKIKDQTT